jgi:hypothetical protein
MKMLSWLLYKHAAKVKEREGGNGKEGMQATMQTYSMVVAKAVLW